MTFTSTKVNANAKLGWSLAGGGTVTPDGSVYFSWAGYEQNGGAKGPVNLYVSRSADGGASWTTTVLDVSGAPPDCSAQQCGWAYLGAQITLLCAEINVVRVRRLWPRSLAPPPTIEADRQVMRASAEAEQRRPEQTISVSFRRDEPVAGEGEADAKPQAGSGSG